jgi:hypothetical protein
VQTGGSSNDGGAASFCALCLETGSGYDLDRIAAPVFLEVVEFLILQARAAALTIPDVALATPEQRTLTVEQIGLGLAAV